MNFRKLLTYLTVGTAAVIPFAGAQNPTILQGSYISNVFGNSNFVLNPNAQTNIANVTNATRSTTTPLVATSEFTLALASGANATWTLRAFDAGMKGQNCEARFSYRGFATATTKAEIVQNSLVVATLTLTPSTDPRIASINFPCGDLVNATTFRIAQTTAAMTGTNEIGGIYVGLATNMANVAQAEFVGAVKWATAASCQWLIGTNVTTYGNFAADADCTTPTSGNIEGQASAPSTKVPGITFSNLKPGRYIFTATGLFQSGGGAGSTASYYAYFRFHDGTNAAKNENTAYMTRVVGTDGPGSPVITGEFEYSAAQSNVTIQIQGKTNSVSPNGAYAVVDAQSQPLYISVYRFPSSSELVVTPERQNTFGGVVYTGQSQSLFNTTAAGSTRSRYDAATWNQPTLLKGKAAVSTTNSGNTLGFSIPNLPVGKYKVEISGLINAGNQASTLAGGYVWCNFFIKETTLSVDVAKQAHQDQSYSTGTTDETRDYPNGFSGVFDNTSVGTRDFVLEAMKFADTTTGNVGVCQAFSQTSAASYNTNITFLLTPLDQPSNSALYVEGPVKAAATGAAIPAGYQHEGITTVSSSLSNQTNGVVKTGTGVTLTPGVWLVDMFVEVGAVAPTKVLCGISKTSNGAPVNDDRSFTTSVTVVDSGNVSQAYTCKSYGYFNVTTSTTFYPNGYATAPTSSLFFYDYRISAIRLN